MSAAVRTALARVSTSPKPDPDGSSASPELVAGLANADDGGVGCDTAERRSVGIRLCTNDPRDYGAVTVAIVGAVAGVHVVAAGNEMGEQSMARHAGIDDGDGLPGSARELPDVLQGEAIQLACISCVGASGRCCDATLLLLRGSRRRRRARFGQHRIVDRRRRNRGEACGALTEREGGENASDAKPHDSAQCESSRQAQTTDQPVQATDPTRQRYYCREREILQHFDCAACKGIDCRTRCPTQHAQTDRGSE